MKHVVIDTRIIETSTGRYMQRLLENIHDHHLLGDIKYTALMPSEYVEKWQKRLPNISIKAADQKWYSFSEQWSLYRLLKALKPDLVHFTMPQQPFLYNRPAITTIHDTTLIRFTNYGDKNKVIYNIKKQIFTQLVKVVLGRAKRVLVPTEFVKNDITDYFGNRYRSTITVTYEAGEIPSVDPEPLQAFANKRFFFFVGNAFPYKNVKRTILAHQQLVQEHPDVHLLLAGKKDFFYTELEQFTIDNAIPNVHFLGFVSDAEKRWLFQNAVAFVGASKSEGFCVPILEAMQEKTVSILSNASCQPEVGGDAALYFNPDSTDELADAMKKILTNKRLRAGLIAKGEEQVKKFSWKKMTDETVAIYKEYL